MILQAYDFLELHRRYDCVLQMGGSDQWGNIVNGIELARRTDQASLFGLTTNLLTTSSGAKMGKTAKGAVWLNEDLLSVYDYWQFWRNTEDEDIVRFLRSIANGERMTAGVSAAGAGSCLRRERKKKTTESTTPAPKALPAVNAR